MNNIDNSNIRHYIDRFLAGETSCAEEKMIYDFFRRGQLADDLEKYREMFLWYDSLAPEAVGEAEPAPEAATTRRRAPKVRLLRLRPWQWIGVAAMLTVLFAIGFIFHSPSTSIPEEYLAYEGSYIIRDGKKITDLRVVVPEILRTEQLVDERLSALDASIEAADMAFDHAVSNAYNLSDPDVKEIIDATLTY